MLSDSFFTLFSICLVDRAREDRTYLSIHSHVYCLYSQAALRPNPDAMFSSAVLQALAQQPDVSTIHTNPFKAKRAWPPDFSKLPDRQQFRLERKYRRRTKLKYARPNWMKATKLAQWGAIGCKASHFRSSKPWTNMCTQSWWCMESFSWRWMAKKLLSRVYAIVTCLPYSCLSLQRRTDSQLG